jgi:hypothetical protein
MRTWGSDQVQTAQVTGAPGGQHATVSLGSLLLGVSMPIRQTADAAAQSTVSGAITAVQTTITLVSATGFPAILAGGQQSVTILDSGNPAWNASTPLATPYEYQQVNVISGNVLTFGPGGGAATRSSFAGTTPKSFFAGATVAATLLAEDIVASAPWKYDEQTPTTTSVTIPASGSIPASYLGVSWRHIQIKWTGRTTSGNNSDQLGIQFNGDTGASYDNQVLLVNAGTTTPAQSFANTVGRVGFVPGATTGAPILSAGRIEIFNYVTNTARRYVEAFCIQNVAGITFGFEMNATGWRNSTAAITSILLAPTTGSFASNTLFTTYLIP